MVPADIDRLPLAEDLRRKIQRWLEDPAYGETREELEHLVRSALQGDPNALAELADAFGGTLPIGTGGRRGPTGPGPNRFNAVVVRQTAAAVAAVIEQEGLVHRAAIAYDTRAHSRAFAQVAAETLADRGVETLVLDAPRPTPQASFFLRRRTCGGGAVISASHNPPRDNGIKVYGPDGAQLVGEASRALMRAVADGAVVRAHGPKRRAGVTRLSGASLATEDAAYHRCVLAQGVTRDDLGAGGLCVVYTPLHGVGAASVVPVLRARGLDPIPVPAQYDPDGGRFSTVRTANPEDPAAFERARAVAEGAAAHLVIATDPDADRLGALARGPDGKLVFVDGNRLAVLMLDHVLRHAADPTGWVLSTLVTTPLVAKLAAAAGVPVVDDLLVGFKHHAGMVREAPERPVVFACEESHGYLRGNEVREKDGAIAALLLCEAAAEAHAGGGGLFERLGEVWARLGYHREVTVNLRCEGPRGRRGIESAMETIRNGAPGRIGPFLVERWEDRLRPRHTGSPTRDLPGDVVVLHGRVEGPLAGARLVFRPSGTEPKLKIYVLGWADPTGRKPGKKETAAVDEAVRAVAKAAASLARARMGEGR